MDLIRFVCSQCRTQLTVNGSLAGVTGPCPSCGSMVTAPTLEEKIPSPVVVQPRLTRQDSASASSTSSPQHGESADKMRARSRPGHSVNPRTGWAMEHEEKKELRIVIKMLLAAVFVAAVVAFVVLWLKYR